MLFLFYGKVLWQKFIFHFPNLIQDTKNGSDGNICGRNRVCDLTQGIT